MSLKSRINQIANSFGANSDACRCRDGETPQFEITPGVWERKDCASYTAHSTCERCGKQRETLHFTFGINGNVESKERAQ